MSLLEVMQHPAFSIGALSMLVVLAAGWFILLPLGLYGAIDRRIAARHEVKTHDKLMHKLHDRDFRVISLAHLYEKLPELTPEEHSYLLSKRWVVIDSLNNALSVPLPVATRANQSPSERREKIHLVVSNSADK